jgi:hypothetical protein
MPLKWKIFFALNIVIGLPAFVFLIMLCISFFNARVTHSSYLYFALLGFVLSMMTLNGFLNIFLLQRFYPDKLIPAGAKNLNLASLVFTSIGNIGLFLLCIYAALDEFNSGRSDNTSKIALSLLSLTAILQTIILFMQAQLLRLITRNHYQRIDSLIDSIGQQPKQEN